MIELTERIASLSTANERVVAQHKQSLNETNVRAMRAIRLSLPRPVDLRRLFGSPVVLVRFLGTSSFTGLEG